LIKIIETPRDAFQGIPQFIPTDQKVRIINSLLQVGFDTVEVGSFVSEKAIPQMADTAEVLKNLDVSGSKSRIMVLVGNKRGGMEAVQRSRDKGQSGKQQGGKGARKRGSTEVGNWEPRTANWELGTANRELRTGNWELRTEYIDDILYPFSVSASFLKRNLNTDFDRAKGTILDLMEICDQYDKRLIVYLTMAFGNPYGDKWDPGIVEEWAGYIYELGLRVIPLSDILGNVTPATITTVYSRIIKTFPEVEFGIHLHSRPGEEYDRINAAWKAGVRRFDSVTGGFGGCPMTDDDLVSNLDTFTLIHYCRKNGIEHGLDLEQLEKARELMAEGIVF
jgi:hydroxymethylglutaryl-CoA lyase